MIAAPLFQRVLGEVWADLPQALKTAHQPPVRMDGSVTIERGAGYLARLIAAILRFPATGADLPISVTMALDGDCEVWTRTVGGRRFASRLRLGSGAFAGLIKEWIGPCAFGMAPIWRDGALHLPVRRWTAFGLPMPLFLAPVSDSFEAEAEGAFRFHIALSHPLTGLLLRYHGRLRPA